MKFGNERTTINFIDFFSAETRTWKLVLWFFKCLTDKPDETHLGQVFTTI